MSTTLRFCIADDCKHRDDLDCQFKEIYLDESGKCAKFEKVIKDEL